MKHFSWDDSNGQGGWGWRVALVRAISFFWRPIFLGSFCGRPWSHTRRLKSCLSTDKRFCKQWWNVPPRPQSKHNELWLSLRFRCFLSRISNWLKINQFKVRDKCIVSSPSFSFFLCVKMSVWIVSNVSRILYTFENSVIVN